MGRASEYHRATVTTTPAQMLRTTVRRSIRLPGVVVLGAFVIALHVPRLAPADPPSPAAVSAPPHGALVTNALGFTAFAIAETHADAGASHRLTLSRRGAPCVFVLDLYRERHTSQVRFVHFGGAAATACTGGHDRVRGRIRFDRPDAPGEITLTGSAATVTLLIEPRPAR